MGEPEGQHVPGELVGELAISQARAPGAQVDLVDAHRSGMRVGRGPCGQPVPVAPGVRGLDHDGRRRGRGLGALGHRVGLLPPGAVPGEDLVLVPLTTGHARDEELPHAAGAQLAPVSYTHLTLPTIYSV